MARINRSDIIQKAVNDLALNTSVDAIPNETSDKIVLTYDLNSKFSNFCITVNSGSSGTLTLTPPNLGARSDVYITALTLAVIKDVVCDVSTGRVGLNATPDYSNIDTTLLAIPVINLTAQSGEQNISLPYPLKIKQGTTLTITSTFTAGVMYRCASAFGFTTSSN